MQKRSPQQNKLYHEYCGLLYKEKQVTVWDGRFRNNPVRFPPDVFEYNEFRRWMAELDLEYPRGEEGKVISSTMLSVEQMASHLGFLEALCSEIGKV